jgi:hypothetical protein
VKKEKTVDRHEFAAIHGVHPSTVRRWYALEVDPLPTLTEEVRPKVSRVVIPVVRGAKWVREHIGAKAPKKAGA